MASRITVHYKCCCGAEIDFDVDEYKRTWLDERLAAFSELHKECPEKMNRTLSEMRSGFVPGLYATNQVTGNVPIPACFSGKSPEADPS